MREDRWEVGLMGPDSRAAQTRPEEASRLCVASDTVKDSDSDPVHESPRARAIAPIGMEAARVARRARLRQHADLARRHAGAYQRAARERAEIEQVVSGAALDRRCVEVC